MWRYHTPVCIHAWIQKNKFSGGGWGWGLLGYLLSIASLTKSYNIELIFIWLEIRLHRTKVSRFNAKVTHLFAFVRQNFAPCRVIFATMMCITVCTQKFRVYLQKFRVISQNFHVQSRWIFSSYQVRKWAQWFSYPFTFFKPMDRILKKDVYNIMLGNHYLKEIETKFKDRCDG